MLKFFKVYDTQKDIDINHLGNIWIVDMGEWWLEKIFVPNGDFERFFKVGAISDVVQVCTTEQFDEWLREKE